MALSEELNDKVDDEIAVYYAYGEIKEDITGGFAQESAITSKQMTKDLQELREDDDVKAVVLRVAIIAKSESTQPWSQCQRNAHASKT